VKAIVIGGGPAGLMAAEQLAKGGVAVDLYDAMPSVGRKFLMAGKGGLNLTHAEDAAKFVTRYGDRASYLHLNAFGADALRAWAGELGIETFVGTSQRVFPKEMKAAPLLRAWLRRLRSHGVTFHMRHKWTGWEGDALTFANGVTAKADAVVFALGGASWPQLGSDGAWTKHFDVAPLKPANCGFDVAWSDYMKQHFAGAPVKPVVGRFGAHHRRGEFIVSESGVEGSLIYAFSAALRDEIERKGHATFLLDVAPHKTVAELARARGKASLSTHLRKRAGIDGVRAALVRELCTAEEIADDKKLAEKLKALPLKLLRPRPIAEVISTAGGIRFDGLTADLMLKDKPGVFVAGEMLDWEAPTGGYLLTACFATGKAAGAGALTYLKR
jgi:uncharacterized flavoprotein (TIGR03862 family)